jgi:cytochrome c-type biogenesis protein
MTSLVAFPVAFLAGVVSFFSPCVLPLLPAYLSLMTGLSVSELAESDRPMGRVLVPALMFVGGFSLIFVGMGASASVLGQFLAQYRDVAEKVGGVVVVALGVLMLGIIKVPWLYGEARIDPSKARALTGGAAFVMGMAFAAGWTPCVGPILASTLALASQSESVGQGALLLVAYSAGLGIPFIGMALLFGRVRPVLSWMSRHALTLNRASGAVLIVIGVLLFTGQLEVVATVLTRVIPTFSL